LSFEESYYRHTSEERKDVEMKEVSEAIKATFIKREGPVVLACGDDRGLTEESLTAMKEAGLPIEDAYLRIYGGIYGATRALLVAATAQHGREAIYRIGDNFIEASAITAKRASEQDVIMITHSAESAENNPAHINEHSHAGLGCAYATGIGKVSNLTAYDQLIIRSAEYEATSVFGTPQDDSVQRLVRANRILVEDVFGKDEPMSISRRDVIGQKVPAMILEGSHASTDKVVHVLNFSEDLISDPREANIRGVHYYDTDVVQLAEVLIKAWPELELDAELLVNAIILDAAATRAALAAADGPADPQRIESLRLGDAHQAIAHLTSL
jgi:hypothetical protein